MNTPYCLARFAGLVLALVISNPPWLVPAVHGQDPVSLAGTWKFALDADDRGLEERWFARDLDGTIELPGSLQERGFGDPPSVETKWMGDLNERSFFTEPRYAPYRVPGNFKFPYWLTPTRYYAGAAWYQREVDVPVEWKDRMVTLRLERPHWGTTVWLDEVPIGSRTNLAVPHDYDLGTGVSPGRHRLTVRVDNRYLVPVGVNSHSVSDHTQGNWNGLVGALELSTRAAVWFDQVQVSPERGSRSALVRVVLARSTNAPIEAVWTTTVRRWTNGAASGPVLASRVQTVRIGDRPRSGGVTVNLPLEKAYAEWDEFSPALYQIDLELEIAAGAGTDAGVKTRREMVTGLREVGVQGRQITINGRPIFLRGTLECCIFPRTGYPPTDVASWRRVMEISRAHGLNHLRFHSWTPPEAAFAAADQLGFYLYVECPTWANGDSSVGDGKPVDAWIYGEGDRILREYGHHPSFVMMSYGNEPGGKDQKRWLGGLVRHWKNLDKRRLFTSGAGWPMIPESDFHVTPDARAFPVHAKQGETAGDYGAWLARQTAPVVSHEIGQYCVFPNLDEIPKYDGWLKAGNFEIVKDFLEQAGMGHQARDFLRASGRLQVLFYKDEIEACLRTSGWGGFELLDLHDFPGQGTALVGILDPFWEGKGYVAPAEFRRFCDETVPLARLTKRVWTTDEAFKARVDVAHFGAADLRAPVARWRIREVGGRTVADGRLEVPTLPTGKLTTLGEIEFKLGKIKRPTALHLEVALAKTRFVNDWNFWVYPESVEAAPPPGVRVISRWDAEAERLLADGASVVLFADPKTVAGKTVGRFDPIFWNKMWFPSQPQHTLGLWMDPRHPALAGFPTLFHADWQWQDLQNHSKPMVLDALPKEFLPVVQVIDDWNLCRKLGLVMEARVGAGRVLVCSIDVRGDLAERPAARSFRRSLLDYAAGKAFRPKFEVPLESMRTLFREPTAAEQLGARIIRADSEQPGYPAAHLLDGDPSTLWHTAWGDDAKPWPHEFVFVLQTNAPIAGLRLTPRQDNNRNGWIREFAIYASTDENIWGAPVIRGAWSASASPQEVRFDRPVLGPYFRVVARSGFDTQPFASLAEIEPLLPSTGVGGPP